MSVIGSNILAGASGQGGGYNLTKSLRFRSSASAYLNRTPASAGNRKTWTWSGWVKRGTLGTNQSLFTCYFANNDTSYLSIAFTSDNLNIGLWNTSILYTSAVYRDPSAWYHIVLAIDTTQATDSNRAKLYVNGIQVTAFGSTGYPAQNTDLAVNSASAHYISTYDGTNYKFDGYLAEVNFVDGLALTPSSFGETSTTTGVWIPKKYTGTYGTNGFYLDFEDTSSTAALGYDAAGSNDWTVNNISLTSGSTYDSMTDVPTLTDITTANYCVLSPIDTYDNPPTEGNLRRTGVGHTGSPWSTCRAVLGVSSGKWYFEGTFTGSTGSVGNNMIGVMTTTTSTLSDAYGGSTTRSYQANGGLQGDNSTGTVSSATSGDVIMIAFDVDAGKLWVGKNGTWMNSGVPASGTGNVFTTLPTSPIVPQVSMYGNTGDNYGWFTNFGQRPFSYTPPTGFVALNTFNLPTPTIGATASSQSNKYMNIALWTANETARTIDVGFEPGLVWAKSRSTAWDHTLFDSVRGSGKSIKSNTTGAEATSSTSLTGFVSNGFTLGVNSDGPAINYATGQTFVGWAWQANGSGSSNTDGTITSTVSANTTAGFSIVTYNTGSAGNQTVGHGLGVTPAMIIIKSRVSTATHWDVWHKSFSNPAQGYMYLNLTNAVANDSRNWANTAPTSTVFSYESGYEFSANSNYVAYCWAEVAGYSAFGSYTGNGSSDGPFIFTGFRPKYLMIKSSTVGENWNIEDTSRSPYNQTAQVLYANNNRAEEPYYPIDILSNGFKVRSLEGGTNESGQTYIYMAFCESPFKFSNAR